MSALSRILDAHNLEVPRICTNGQAAKLVCFRCDHHIKPTAEQPGKICDLVGMSCESAFGTPRCEEGASFKTLRVAKGWCNDGKT